MVEFLKKIVGRKKSDRQKKVRKEVCLDGHYLLLEETVSHRRGKKTFKNTIVHKVPYYTAGNSHGRFRTGDTIDTGLKSVVFHGLSKNRICKLGEGDMAHNCPAVNRLPKGTYKLAGILNSKFTPVL
ncbi:MAG TPA: hypothetical protein PKI61_01215 [bacterium]|nr:hypothetical protein [bacterium]HPT29708.1 hypothetical protein [bacterium]